MSGCILPSRYMASWILNWRIQDRGRSSSSTNFEKMQRHGQVQRQVPSKLMNSLLVNQCLLSVFNTSPVIGSLQYPIWNCTYSPILLMSMSGCLTHCASNLWPWGVRHLLSSPSTLWLLLPPAKQMTDDSTAVSTLRDHPRDGLNPYSTAWFLWAQCMR